MIASRRRMDIRDCAASMIALNVGRKITELTELIEVILQVAPGGL